MQSVSATRNRDEPPTVFTAGGRRATCRPPAPAPAQTTVSKTASNTPAKPLKSALAPRPKTAARPRLNAT